MKVIDIFCGAGGFSEGFRQAGFEVIWGVDKWEPAVITHRANHPSSQTVMDDVERLSLLPDEEFNEMVPDAEVIIGSPPCVAFSNSNRSGKGDKAEGMRLIEAFLRIVARKKWKSGIHSEILDSRECAKLKRVSPRFLQCQRSRT